MEVITIESESFKQIISQIQEIKEFLNRQQKEKPFADAWLDNDEVCQLLKISKRTLQTYRDEGKLSFSQVGSKIYYLSSEVDNFLRHHYKKAFATKH